MNNHTSSNTTTLQACGAWLSTSTFSHEPLGNIIFTVLSALTQLALLVVLFLRRQKLRSEINSNHQANLDTHLLPIHILFLQISVAVYFVQAVTINIPALASVATNNNPNNYNSTSIAWIAPCLTKGIVWGLQHFCIDGVAVLLCQPGIGSRAVRQTIKWMVPWAFFTAVTVSGACWFTQYSSQLLDAYMLLQMAIYATVAFSKLQCQPCRHKRPAFRNYALVWIVLRLMALTTDGIALLDPGSAACLQFLVVQTTFVCLIPWAIYNAFRDDTAFWYGYAFEFVAEATRSRGGSRSRGSGIEGTEEKKEKEGATKSEKIKKSKKNRKSKKKKSSKNNDEKNGSDDIRRPLLGLTLPDGTLTDINVGIESLNPSDIISFAELSIDVLKLLGAGAAAKVYKGTCRGRPAAFKLVFTPTINRKVIQAFFKEASLLRACSAHPNVVNLIGVSIAPPSLAHVLELCDGTLREELDKRRKGRGGSRRGHRNRKHVSSVGSATRSSGAESGASTVSGAGSISSLGSGWSVGSVGSVGTVGSGGIDAENPHHATSLQLRFFVDCSLQCARSLEFLHSRNILHRDLKSLNFLVVRGVDGSLVVKLADMDRAVQLESNSVDAWEEKEPSQDIVGTVQWAAPEVLRMEEHSSTRASDVYSLGVVCWECLSLCPPFGSLSFKDIVRLVTSGQRLPIETGTSRETVEMFERCWSGTPGERPEASELVSFFESRLDSLSTLSEL